MPRPSAKKSNRKREKERKEETKFKYSSVLSDREIKKAYRRGDIVIEPYRREQVKPNSYDIRLGEFFYRQRAYPRGLGDDKPVNIYKKSTDLWGDDYERATTLRAYIVKTHKKSYDRARAQNQRDARFSLGVTPKSTTLNIAKMLTDRDIERIAQKQHENINLDDRVFVLKPGETVLGHTDEFIGGVEGVTTMIKTRSSLGRNNIGICKCAGWGDTGFTNRWTLEITNFSKDRSVMLVCGRRVGQIVFMATGKVSRKYDSKYQSQHSLKKMKKEWKPEMMLPRLHLDKECVKVE